MVKSKEIIIIQKERAITTKEGENEMKEPLDTLWKIR